MNFKTSGTIMAAALAAALAAAAPATAAPRGGHAGGHGSMHMSGGGGGARMAVSPGAGRSMGLAAASRPNFAGANYAANRPSSGNWSNHSGNWSGNNWRGRHHRGYGFGAGFAAGALIGSAPYYYGDGYGYDDYAYADGYDDSYVAAPAYGGDGDDASCAQLYRSYDPRSGTFLGNDGLRHPCP